MTQKNKENELNKKTEETVKPKLKQPSGWKRTHELKPKDLGVEHLEAEWTKENTKCVITRDPNTEGKRKYTFKLVKIANGKQTWGKNTFNNVRDALAESYRTMMS